MKQTRVGLPNSCSICGNTVLTEMWWADNDDFARAGSGVCDNCRAPKPTQMPTENSALKQPEPNRAEPIAIDRKPKGKAK